MESMEKNRTVCTGDEGRKGWAGALACIGPEARLSSDSRKDLVLVRPGVGIPLGLFSASGEEGLCHSRAQDWGGQGSRGHVT